MRGQLSTNLPPPQGELSCNWIGNFLPPGMADEDRMVKIQSALAHLDQLTEALNETVIEQDKTLRRLNQQLEQLTERMAKDNADSIKSNNAKPPHYQ